MSFFETFQFTINARTAVLCNNGTYLSRTVHNVPGLVRDIDGCVSKTIGIDHAVFTNSFYVINDANNSLAIRIGSGDVVVYRLLKGNFTASTFIPAARDVLGAGWDISVNPTTGVFTFSYLADVSIVCDACTCQTILGLPYGPAVSLQSTGNGALVLPYPCNFMGAQSLVLRSGSIPCQNLDSTGSPFLVNIPVTSAPYEQTYFTNLTRYGCMLPPTYVLDQWELNIDDEFGTAVNFNNTNWVVTLFVTYEFAKPTERLDTLTELFKQYFTHAPPQTQPQHRVASNALVTAGDAGGEKKRKLDEIAYADVPIIQ